MVFGHFFPNTCTKVSSLLNFRSNTLEMLNGAKTPLFRPQWHHPMPTHLAVAEEVTLDPRSCTLIKTLIRGPDPRITINKEPPNSMTVRPLAGDHEMEMPVIASWGLVSLKQEDFWIEVMNPGIEAITLPIGVPIAMAENYDSEIMDPPKQEESEKTEQ